MESKTVTQAELQGIVNNLHAKGARLITIVGADTGENIEVMYFFHTGISQTEVTGSSCPRRMAATRR